MSNFRALSLDEFLKGIDEMDIYEKDYKIIQQLLNADGNFFVKILEEVLLGNVYFSDFERIFKDDRYAEILKRNFEVETEILDEVKKLSETRARLTTAAITSHEIGLTRDVASTNPKLDEYYNEELREQREDFLYQIFTPSTSDSELETLAKLKMFNAMKNYKFADLKNSGDSNKIKINEFGKLEYAAEEDKITAEYFNPEDLLFYVNEGVIPIAYDKQTITSMDEDFMKTNGISLSEMKKIKALASFFNVNSLLEEEAADE